MKTIVCTALAFFSVLLCSLNARSETIFLDSGHQSIEAGKFGGILIDTTLSLQIDSLMTPGGRALFQATHQAVPNYPIARQVYWFMYDVLRDTSAHQWVISINNPSIRRIDLFMTDSTGVTGHFVLGAVMPFSGRTLKNRNYILPLAIKPGAHCSIYLRVDGGDLGHFFPIMFESVAEVSSRVAYDALVYGVYTGVMLFMTVLSLFFLFSVKDKTYLFYSLSVLVTWALNLVIDGVAFQYFFTNQEAPFTWGYISSVIMLQVADVLFAREYLHTRSMMPRLDKALWVQLFFAIAAPLAASLYSINAAVQATVLTTFAMHILVVAAGIVSMRLRHRPARFYLAAILTNVVFSIGITLYYHGMLDHGFVYSGIVGTALYVIIISFGLGDQLSIARREKEEVQLLALKNQTDLTNAFSRFVPQEMLAFLGKEHIKDVVLGDVVQREMTIMFSDIRSFTTISEHLTSRENFVFLNEYLRFISPIIRQNNGFIDKYIGDAILAIFPRDVASAVEAGVGMLRNLRKFNEMPVALEAPVSIGIGIHTGEVMLGTIGEEERFDTTVIADVVNMASRLEGLTKYYGNSLLVTEEVIQAIEPMQKYHSRFVDRVTVKGSNRNIDIFEIFDGDTAETMEAKLQTEPVLSAAITMYLQGQFRESLEGIREVLSVMPDDSLALLYQQRIEYNLQYNIPAESVSVTSFEQKRPKL